MADRLRMRSSRVPPRAPSIASSSSSYSPLSTRSDTSSLASSATVCGSRSTQNPDQQRDKYAADSPGAARPPREQPGAYNTRQSYPQRAPSNVPQESGRRQSSLYSSNIKVQPGVSKQPLKNANINGIIPEVGLRNLRLNKGPEFLHLPRQRIQQQQAQHNPFKCSCTPCRGWKAEDYKRHIAEQKDRERAGKQPTGPFAELHKKQKMKNNFQQDQQFRPQRYDVKAEWQKKQKMKNNFQQDQQFRPQRYDVKAESQKTDGIKNDFQQGRQFRSDASNKKHSTQSWHGDQQSRDGASATYRSGQSCDRSSHNKTGSVKEDYDDESETIKRDEMKHKEERSRSRYTRQERRQSTRGRDYRDCDEDDEEDEVDEEDEEDDLYDSDERRKQRRQRRRKSSDSCRIM